MNVRNKYEVENDDENLNRLNKKSIKRANDSNGERDTTFRVENP